MIFQSGWWRYRRSRRARVDFSHPLARGLVGCWLMNEGAGLKCFDVAQNRHHGTLNNTQTQRWFNSGQSPWGPRLGYTAVASRCDVSHHATLDITGDMTIVAFMRPNSVDTRVCMEKSSDTAGFANCTYGFGWTPTLQFIHANVFVAASTYTVTSGNYQHFAMVRTVSDTTITYYVDGRKHSSASYGATVPVSNTESLGIGSRGAGQGGLEFDGQWDYCLIYNRALTPGEVAMLHREGFPFLVEDEPHITNATLFVTATFNEVVQVGPIVIVPSVRALASFVERPLRTFVVVPSVVDTLGLGQTFNEVVQVGPIVVAPSSRDRLQAVERPLRVFAILPSVIDIRGAFQEFPTAVITFVIRTKSRQTMVERSLRIFAVVPGSPFPDIMADRPTATIRIVSSSRDLASLSDRPRAIIVIDPSRSDGFHRIGPLEKLVALWSGSSEAFQSPLLVDPDWVSDSTTEEVQTFGNIGKPGQTYQVGTGTRGVTPPSGRVQTVDSDVTLKE